MYKMDGVVISDELVRPSSPTPQNLRTHKLSFLDRFTPATIVPIVLYFPHAIPIFSDPEFTRLKRSLSLTLTRFYPLAGRISGDRKSIDCNDEGVPFSVVKFTGHKLSDLLINPDPNLPSSLLPKTDSNRQCPNSTLALIQLSFFDAGGVAIGAVFSHIKADAGTLASFLKSWSAATCGSTRPVSPDFPAQSLFPAPEDLKTSTGGPSSYSFVQPTGKPVARRYRFDAAAISSLKVQSGVASASRVQVLAALFWRCFMAASLANNNAVSVVAQFADLRRRARPKLSPDCFGNFSVPTAAASRNEIGRDAGELVKKLRDSVSTIDADLVNRMSGDEGPSVFFENFLRQISVAERESVDVLGITSWCGFGFYSNEFGWGKPAWVTRCDNGDDPGSPIANRIVLMDTRDGDGVEAWVVLDEKYVPAFDDDEELRALASIDPNPLV